MRGQLHFDGPDGSIDLRARVVRHPDDRFSWHGRLARYDGWHGRLHIDDRGDFDVVVHGAYLDVAP